MSAMSELSHQQQENEEMHRDVERVVEIASKHLGPNDAALLRWACGVDSHKQRWAEMACTCEAE